MFGDLVVAVKTKARDIVRFGERYESIFYNCLFTTDTVIVGPSFHDFIVMGRGKMLGTNVTGFWIFIGAEKQSNLVLATAALQLVIKTNKTKGFYDIKTEAATGVEIITNSYKFGGIEYKVNRSEREKI